MPWEVEYTDEFEAWWVQLSLGEQESIAAVVGVLEQLGPQLPFPQLGYQVRQEARDT